MGRGKGREGEGEGEGRGGKGREGNENSYSKWIGEKGTSSHDICIIILNNTD